MTRLAIEGGTPVRRTPLPYGRQLVDDGDIRAVAEALRGEYLTTGPRVLAFEHAFAGAVGAHHAVAVSSGTAALHAAIESLGIGPGDEVVVPTLTFVASANCALYQGATPVLADVDPRTLLIDPADVVRRLTARTRAVIAVDFAGHPCDYPALETVLRPRGIALVADSCHALGASLGGRSVGTLADVTVFSLHPVKQITAGEGGVATTADEARAERMRTFRHHGMTRRPDAYPWNYEVGRLGQNYRITEFQCALAHSQLSKLDGWQTRRRAIAARYDADLASVPEVRTLPVHPRVIHGYHLYVVQLELDRLRVGRDRFLAALRGEGILATLHYPPIHLHPFFRDRFGYGEGMFPAAEAAARSILSLPIFAGMSDADQSDVLEALRRVVAAYRR